MNKYTQTSTVMNAPTNKDKSNSSSSHLFSSKLDIEQAQIKIKELEKEIRELSNENEDYYEQLKAQGDELSSVVEKCKQLSSKAAMREREMQQQMESLVQEKDAEISLIAKAKEDDKNLTLRILKGSVFTYSLVSSSSLSYLTQKSTKSGLSAVSIRELIAESRYIGRFLVLSITEKFIYR